MDTELHLDDAESKALAAALDAYLPELENEASRVDRPRDAHPLWRRFDLLVAVRGRLPTSEP